MVLKIGELARRTGKSIHALRYYEAEGLIPNVCRDAGSQRIYTERHVLWVKLLIRLRQTGMPMQSIREYARLIEQGDATLEQRKAMLLQHRERVEQEISEMRQCIGLIDEKVQMYDAWLEAGVSPIEVPKVS